VLSCTVATNTDLRVQTGQCGWLLELLALVPDPRRRRGVRHTVASVLALAAAAVLAGACSILAIGEWATEAPQPVLAALHARHSRRHDRFTAPHTETFRRMLRRVDATAVDTAIGLFLAERAGCGGLHSTEPVDAPPAMVSSPTTRTASSRRSPAPWPWMARPNAAHGNPTGGRYTCWRP
jgi:DDE_Tnp_1-associated